MSLARSILEYGASCWDSYKENQIEASDRVKESAAKFANYTNGSAWETISQRRKTALICASSKHTPENGHGKLYMTEYKDHAN